MTRKNGNRAPTGCKYEQFTYLPKLSFYTNSSDMKKLPESPIRRY